MRALGRAWEQPSQDRPTRHRPAPSEALPAGLGRAVLLASLQAAACSIAPSSNSLASGLIYE